MTRLIRRTFRSDDTPLQRAANILAMIWGGGDPKVLERDTVDVAAALQVYADLDKEARHGALASESKADNGPRCDAAAEGLGLTRPSPTNQEARR